jgi:ATP-binding cassette subfamily B protein
MNSLLSLKKYFVRYKKKLIWGIIFILLSNASAIYIPIFLKDGIDSLKDGVAYGELARYAVLIVVASLFSGIFRYMIRQTIIVMSREIEYDLRTDFWAHIQRLPLRYFQNTSTGNIMAHATNDINAVRSFLGPAVMYSIDTLTRFIIVLAIMLSFNYEITLYSLIPLPFLSYLVYKLGTKVHTKFTRIQEQFSTLTAKAQESFSGIRVVKSYVREDNEVKEFREMSQEYLRRNMDMIKVQSYFQPILFLITGISAIIVLWFGGLQVINGTLTLGELSAFTVYLGMLIWPIIAFGWVINLVQQGAASMKRINNAFDEKFEIEDAPGAIAQMPMKGNIEFKNVEFKYAEHLPAALKNINLTIRAGETAAIIGHTGSGKTSLVNLIPRLYDVTKGEVLIDGVNVKNLTLSLLRKSIGLASQETFLFSDTITNNIGYGMDDINEELVDAASGISQLKKDVEGFPLKFDTILGERGITLSGGQKQRTSLARALAVDPKILILDDTFSAVDTNTEEEILRGLREFMRNRTSIIISHRISTVKDADVIFVLKDGEVAERGTHESLIALNGIYADLHFKQLLEKELEELK